MPRRPIGPPGGTRQAAEKRTLIRGHFVRPVAAQPGQPRCLIEPVVYPKVLREFEVACHHIGGRSRRVRICAVSAVEHVNPPAERGHDVIGPAELRACRDDVTQLNRQESQRHRVIWPKTKGRLTLLAGPAKQNVLFGDVLIFEPSRDGAIDFQLHGDVVQTGSQAQPSVSVIRTQADEVLANCQRLTQVFEPVRLVALVVPKRRITVFRGELGLVARVVRADEFSEYRDGPRRAGAVGVALKQCASPYCKFSSSGVAVARASYSRKACAFACAKGCDFPRSR